MDVVALSVLTDLPKSGSRGYCITLTDTDKYFL